MPQVLYDKTGRPVTVPDDQVAQALSTGQVGMAQPINVISPSGDVFHARTPDEYLEAVNSGFRIETGSEATHRRVVKEYGDRNMEAFLAGTARGATLGLSDLILTETGAVDKQTLAGLMEANPTLTLGSELLGSFAPGAAIGKGLSLAAKAFRVAPEAIAGLNAAEQAASPFALLTSMAPEGAILKTLAKGGDKLIAAAGVGAVEGSAFGLQQGITEQALGDPQAAAEGILAHIGEGALTGMLFGGALGATALGVGAVGGRLKKLTAHVEEALQPALERRRTADIFSDLGIEARALRKLRDDKGEAWFKDVSKMLREDAPDGQSFTAGTREENIARLKETLDYHGRHINGAIEALAREAEGQAGKAAGREIAIESRLAEKGLRREGDELFAGAAPEGPRAAGEKRAAAQGAIQLDSKDLVRKVRAISDDLSKAPGDDAAQKTIEAEAKRLEDTFKGGEMSLSEAQQWRQSYRRAWDGPADPNTSRWAQRQVERVIQEELTDKALEIAKATKNVPLYKELVRSRKAYATLADVADAAKAFDMPGGMLGQAVGEFAKSFGLRSLVFGQSPLSAAIGAAGYTAVKAGKQVLGPLAKKVASLRNLQETNEKVVGRLDGAVARFIDAATGATAKGAVGLPTMAALEKLTGEGDREAATKKFVEALRVAANSPDILADRIAMNLLGVEEHAPTVAAQMAQRMVQGIKMLETLLPPTPRTVQPQLAKYTDGDMSRVEEAALALIDPVSVIEGLASGVPPTPSQMAILRTVYERVWSLTTAQIAQKLAEQTTEVDYDYVRLLSSFSGQPLDWSMEPAAIARAQELYQPQGQGPGSKGGGLQALQGAMQNFQSEPGRLAAGQLGGR